MTRPEIRLQINISFKWHIAINGKGLLWKVNQKSPNESTVSKEFYIINSDLEIEKSSKNILIFEFK